VPMKFPNGFRLKNLSGIPKTRVDLSLLRNNYLLLLSGIYFISNRFIHTNLFYHPRYHVRGMTFIPDYLYHLVNCYGTHDLEY